MLIIWPLQQTAQQRWQVAKIAASTPPCNDDAAFFAFQQFFRQHQRQHVTRCRVPPAAPLQAERAEIVKGEKEAPAPEASEADQKSSEPAAGGGEVGKEGDEEDVPPGIPEFWLNVLRNYEEIGNRVRALRILSSPFLGFESLRFLDFKSVGLALQG